MLNRIQKLWWLFLAWLLAICGGDFWHFNVMEAFATLAIIVGAFFTIRKIIQVRKRNNKLVIFPNNWSAEYNEGVLSINASVHIYLPYKKSNYNCYAYMEGKLLPMQFSDYSPYLVGANGCGVELVGKASLNYIPSNVILELCVKVNLDEEIKVSSGKRKLTIINVHSGSTKIDKEGIYE